MLDFRIHPWRDGLLFEEIVENGEPFLVIRDPSGFASQNIQMPKRTWEQLQFFNVSDINSRIDNGEFELEVDIDQIRSVVFNLDVMGYLDSPRLAYLKEEQEAYEKSNIRPAICVGEVYPDDRTELATKISKILSLSAYESESNPIPRIVLAPHLGYDTGFETLKTYAEAFAPLINTQGYQKVILFGTSHYADSGMLMLCDKSYVTPLGVSKVDGPLTQRISDLRHCKIDNNAHKQEHSLELHLPFLQQTLGEDVEYIFGLTGNIQTHLKTHKSREEFVTELSGIIHECGESTLLVFSGDLTHIGSKFGDPRTSLDMKEENIDFLEAIHEMLQDAKAQDYYDFVAPQNDKYKVCGLSPFYFGLALANGIELINSHKPNVWEETATGSSVSIASYVFG